MTEATFLVSPEAMGYSAVAVHPAELMALEIFIAPSLDELLSLIVDKLESFPPRVDGIVLRFKLIPSREVN